MRDAKTLVISFILINPCSAMSQLPLCATGVQCTFLARSSGARHAPIYSLAPKMEDHVQK